MIRARTRINLKYSLLNRQAWIPTIRISLYCADYGLTFSLVSSVCDVKPYRSYVNQTLLSGMFETYRWIDHTDNACRIVHDSPIKTVRFRFGQLAKPNFRPLLITLSLSLSLTQCKSEMAFRLWNKNKNKRFKDKKLKSSNWVLVFGVKDVKQPEVGVVWIGGS